MARDIGKKIPNLVLGSLNIISQHIVIVHPSGVRCDISVHVYGVS